MVFLASSPFVFPWLHALCFVVYKIREGLTHACVLVANMLLAPPIAGHYHLSGFLLQRGRLARRVHQQFSAIGGIYYSGDERV